MFSVANFGGNETVCSKHYSFEKWFLISHLENAMEIALKWKTINNIINAMKTINKADKANLEAFASWFFSAGHRVLVFAASLFYMIQSYFTPPNDHKNALVENFIPLNGEIPVRKNIRKTELYLNRQSWHAIQYSKFNHNKNGKIFEDIKMQVWWTG